VGLTNKITSIAIGSFDGIHLAHQALLHQVEAVVVIERNSGYLTRGYRRTHFTNRVCFFYHFDKIKSLSPEAFLQKLQSDFPHLKKIVVGYDFHFGKEKLGNVQTLQTLYEGEVEIIKEISIEGISVHSRTIKTYLKEGNIQKANLLLGREYLIEGEIIKGQGLGKKELFPTLNLEVKGYQLPLNGVYASRTLIKGKWFDSISFLGHRVSTDGLYAIETHILDKQIGQLRGEVALKFVAFIRENKKFSNLEALKAQIEIDISKAKSYF